MGGKRADSGTDWAENKRTVPYRRGPATRAAEVAAVASDCMQPRRQLCLCFPLGFFSRSPWFRLFVWYYDWQLGNGMSSLFFNDSVN